MLEDVDHTWALIVLIVGFAVAIVLACGIGANDVANSFGTSVGSKVLTLRQACYLASIFEILGSALLGYKVSDTIRKGVLDVNIYQDAEKELMLGNIAALAGSAVWQFLATYFSLPISGTHSTVGACVGFSLAARGLAGVQWWTLFTIVLSWFISPLFSGAVSSIIYVIIRRYILLAPSPLKVGLIFLPLIYGLTVLVNVISVILDGPRLLGFDKIPWWGALLLSLGVGVLVALVIQFFWIPKKRPMLEELERSHPKANFDLDRSTASSKESTPAPLSPVHLALDEITNEKELEAGVIHNNNVNNGITGIANGAYINQGVDIPKSDLSSGNITPAAGITPNASGAPLIRLKSDVEMGTYPNPAVNNNGVIALSKRDQAHQADDRPEIVQLFSVLQILTAIFGSFAHGGNDVSNAIGPLVSLWLIYLERSVQQKSETPIYILLYGGVGIVIGLWIWGRKVIKTVGEDLTKVTPSSGFTIEIGSAATVLIASKAGVPISTTHCKVGSVVFVGWTKGTKQAVDWKLFRNIIYAWVITVPFCAGLSAAIMFVLRSTLL